MSRGPRPPRPRGRPTLRLRSPVLLLLLLSGLRADGPRAGIQEKEVQGMVGSSVELSCIYPEGTNFDLNDFYVYWQINEPKTVVTYYLPGNSSPGHEDNHYQHRAELSLHRMERGDFSLQLRNITLQDEQRFHCVVIRKSKGFDKVLEVLVKLHVAANYSMPVVSTPTAPSQDEEVTFTCTSTNGYPQPKVYWVNRTDNSLLDEALQNNTVFLNERGLYNVVSVLRVRWAPTVNVQCCIENELLHQNLTSSSQIREDSDFSSGRITDIPPFKDQERVPVVLIILGTLALITGVAVGLLCRKRCSCGNYTGPL
ncbi:ICOS ligand isoform X2 [Echinops telfairi]|uniref:ICOS ligand isoform X2 n=1 Tax=Echinops telfairi TaxID=9371 RepID=A0AC55CMU5_ECHTE|nr:ICOS ligand isoform X2 [Echinops telfairi]